MSDQSQEPGNPPGPNHGSMPPVYPGYPAYPPYGYPPAPGLVPGPGRPGKVTAAAVITWVGAGLALLVSLFMALRGGAIPDDALRDFPQRFPDIELDINKIRTLIVVTGLVMLLWSASACVLAGLVLRRHNWARVVLAVSASMTILFSLLAITAVVPLLITGSAIAVLVLLFSREANAWFRGEQWYGGAPYPPAWGQQPPSHGPW